MTRRATVPAPNRTELGSALTIFAACLLFNLWGVSVGWESRNLPGLEFRQAQTALSAHFIQLENNFSPAYPTPVLGKPWSVPMEFPLYQWTVVAVSNLTGLELTKAGRLVSVACFYLTLPGDLSASRADESRDGPAVVGAGGRADLSALYFLCAGLPDRDDGADVQCLVLARV